MRKRRAWPWRNTVNSKCRVRFSQKRLSYYLHSQPCLRHVNYHMLYPELLNYLSFRYFLYWFCAIFLPTPPYYQFLFLSSSNSFLIPLQLDQLLWFRLLVDFMLVFRPYPGLGKRYLLFGNMTRHFILHSTLC